MGAQHYGMADEIEFLENYKTHVASTVIMMQVQPTHLGLLLLHAECFKSVWSYKYMQCIYAALRLAQSMQSATAHHMLA